MIDYYDEFGMVDNNKVIKAIREIDEKRKNEKDKSKQTKLLMEQLLRGLYLNPNEMFNTYR